MDEVIIAGGGVAGAAAAAAVSAAGYRVIVVEPGLDHSKRLAGELIHPPGVADLEELGLLDCLKRAGGVAVQGFAVFAGPRKAVADTVLSYSEVADIKNEGLAIEHGKMSELLLDEVGRRPNVSVWKDARISAVDVRDADHAIVTITRGGKHSEVRTPLLIAADGRQSHVRRMAEIDDKRTLLSNMIGYVLRPGELPHPGFGHVFAGGDGPVLAYQIANGEARVMFDVPAQAGAAPDLRALPQPLRNDAARAIENDTPLRSANYCIVPEAVVKGRLVCVGDAGGCCHPVSASGLSTCARDAVRLKAMLEHTPRDVPAALRRYAAERIAPEKTRMTSADLLYEVLRGETPEMRLMRRGLLRYWHQNPRGRSVTMALLSTHETRSSIMMREYLRVARYALPELTHVEERGKTVVGLSKALLKLFGA